MADAKAYAMVVVADVLGDRTQSVVAGIAPAAFQPDLGGRQLDLIVKYDDVARIELVEIRSFGDRSSRLIHICTGQKQENAFSDNVAFHRDALEASPPRRN